MRAEDLRIGNYILDYEADADESIYWQVEEIQRLSNDSKLNQTVGVTYRRGSCWSCDICPVPLTAEWLLKLGFDKDDLTVNLYVKHFKEYSLQLYQNGFSGTLEKDASWFTTIKGYNDQVTLTKQYVHQLQNLYHALTGKELTI